MRPSRLVPLVFCLVVCTAVVTVAAAGAPPPTQLCGACGSDIEGATGAGTLDVFVDASGDSRWVERVPVTDAAADRYREDPTALERAVGDTWGRWHVAGEAAADRSVAVEDGAVVVEYAVADVARQGVGDARVIEYFAADRSNTRYRLAAERVSIHVPDDAVVTNRPPGATVDGATATWTTDADRADDGGFERATYVAYGDGGPGSTASGYATVAAAVGPPAVEQGVVGGVAPGLLIAGAGVVAGRTDWGVDAFDVAGLERLLVATGLLGAGGLVLSSVVATGHPFSPGFGAVSVLGVGYAALGVAARRTPYPRTATGVVGLALAVALLVGLGLGLLGGAWALAALPFGLATALFFPLGYLAERRGVSAVLVVVAALVPIGSATLLSLLLTPMGLGVFVYWLLLAFWAVAVGVFGYPLALLGRRVAAEDGTRRSA